MSTRTITALFDSEAQAQRARQQLTDRGLDQSQTRVVSQQSAGTTAQDVKEPGEHRGILDSIKHFFSADNDRADYEEALRRGGFLLITVLDEDDVDEAIAIIDACDPVDLNQRSEQWRAEGSDRGATEERIPIAEEQLRVGKREIDRGKVRVRSYVVEQPVHEDVRLREERVEVERRPAGMRAGAADPDALEERTVEMTETSEEPVIAKEALVTEEVVIRKFTGERTQGVDETVRRTEVEVDDSRDEAGEPSRPAGSSKSSRKSEERRRPS